MPKNKNESYSFKFNKKNIILYFKRIYLKQSKFIQMKKAFLLFAVSIALFTSCQKTDYSVIVGYDEVTVNQSTGASVVYDFNIKGGWTSYKTQSGKVAEKLTALVNAETKQIKVDISDNEIIDAEKL
jgi:hypothetical protein